MNYYIRKADRKPMKTIMRLKKLNRDNTRLKDANASLKRFIKAMGFIDSSTTTSFGHFYYAAMKVCPECGGIPYIDESQYKLGTYFAECKHCAAHTKSHSKIRDVINAWNADERTELSAMLAQPLTAQSMDIVGARNLVIAIGKRAAGDYKKSVKEGKPDKKIANFLDGIRMDGRPAVEVLAEEALKEDEEDKEVDEFEEY